jgi:pSer/pThr/pTyr-binding forkhead associated (FHA) protein
MSITSLTFALWRDQQLLRRETISQSVIKVGKLTSSHLRIEDEGASRMHAVIEVPSSEDIILIDLGSTHGTFVNGTRVAKCHLHVGDQIQIAETLIVLESADGPSEETPPPSKKPVLPGRNPFNATPPSMATPPPPRPSTIRVTHPQDRLPQASDRHGVFVSYRRSDAKHVTGRIADQLCSEFGDDQIFLDVDSIPFGVDFRTFINQRLEKCRVVLVVIGPSWASCANERGIRLQQPNDHVRLEVEAALKC